MSFVKRIVYPRLFPVIEVCWVCFTSIVGCVLLFYFSLHKVVFPGVVHPLYLLHNTRINGLSGQSLFRVRFPKEKGDWSLILSYDFP